jgi:diguanylate cyclase (GGDEF)-like protein/PAS domain S-box-containing protein
MAWPGVLGTLKFRIVAASVLALALGIAATAAALVWRAERDTLRLRERTELAEAQRTAKLIESRLADHQRALALAAVRVPPAALASSAAMQRELEQRPLLLDSFDAVFMAGRDARMSMIHDQGGFRSPGIGIGDRPYYRAAMERGESSVLAVQVGRPAPEPVVVFASPLHCVDRPCGLLAGTLRLQRRNVLQVLAEADADDKSGRMVLTDADGMILAHADYRRIGQRLADDSGFAAAWQRWRAAPAAAGPDAAGGPAGVALRLSDDAHLWVVARVANAGWLVWRRLPVAEVLAPLQAGRRASLVVAAGLLVALGAVQAVLIFVLLRPLQRLQRRAQHLFDGQQALEQGWPQAGGEIGRLEQVLRRVAGERAELEARSSETTRQLQSVLASAPAGICLTRAQCFELVSAQFCTLFGMAESQLLGQPARLIFAAQDDYDALGAKVGAAFAEGRPYDGEIEMVRANGERFWARLRGLPVERGNPAAGTIWTVHDIGGEVASRDALRWAAEHDPLTGLANRKAFDSRLAQVFARRLPAEGRDAPVLLLFDLDRFKPVNDRFGHPAGDAVLCAVAETTLAGVRSADHVFRLGGDEFAVLLEACPDEAALRVAEGLRAAIDGLVVPWQGHALSVGSSIGVARVRPDHAKVADWVAAADAACYAAKAAGRNRVCLAEARPTVA